MDRNSGFSEMDILLQRIEELARAKQEFQNLVEGSVQGIVIHRNFHLLFANHSLAEIFGYDSPREMLAMGDVSRIIAPEELPRLKKLHEARLRGESPPSRYEFIGLRKDGKRIWVEHDSRQVEWEGEKVVQTTLLDVSERHHVVEALRASQRLLQTVLDTIPHWVFVKDRSSRFIMVNSAFADSHNADPADFVGKNIMDFTAGSQEEQQRILDSDYQALVEGKRVESPEYTVTMRDGRRETRHAIKLPLLDEHGEIVGLVGVSEDITQSRRTEVELVESEARFRDLIDTSLQGAYIHDQHRFLYVNYAFVKIFGYDSQEEVLKIGDCLQFYAPGDRERLNGYYKARISGGAPPVRYEFQGLRKDGSVVWLENLVQVVQWQGRQAVLATVVDISERKLAEQNLQANRRLLQTMFDMIPQALYVKDLQSRYIMVNHALASLHNLDPEKFIGASAAELNIRTQEENEIFLQSDRKAIETRKRVDVPEFTVSLPDGSQQIRRGIKLPFRDDEGKVVGLVGVSEDITERKLAEEELLASRGLLKTVIDTIPHWIFVKDKQGRYLMVNSAMADSFGLQQDEISGIDIRQAGIGTDIEQTQYVETDRQVLETGQRIVVPEIPITLPDGELRVRELTKLPYRNASGEIIGLVGMSQDITERKQQEQAMLQTQKLESLGVLAGGVAHDFNNILVSILGNAELALMTLPDEAPEREEIGQIEIAGQRAADLCRQMLAYSGRAQLRTDQFDLNRLVKDLTNLLQVSISKECRLERQLHTPLPFVIGDPGQIQQVVMNLVINASEAMEDVGGIIAVTTGPETVDEEYLKSTMLAEGANPGDYVYLQVTDTGCGMDEQTFRRIFDPFFTTKFTGRGLGLAAVQGIVRGHRGALKVESSPGRGTTFKLLLPAISSDSPATQHPGEQPVWSGVGTVLVIDDEPTILKVTQRMLQGFGYSVLCAADGNEGVATFQYHADEITLVMLDLTMPAMGGEEALDRLRQIRKDVRVVLMSGYHEQELSDRFSGRGITGFLQKPFEMNILRDKLQNLPA